MEGVTDEGFDGDLTEGDGSGLMEEEVVIWC